MQKITLYRYTRPDGGVTVSPVKPEGECAELYRLTADEGMALTDGTVFAFCVDTENADLFSEVESGDDPEFATEADYQSALSEFGVKV